MKRTIFCVALILCMAIMAGCAAQASGKTQTPISAKTELTSAQEADDTAEVVTALLPSQTVEENSKTEDSADAPRPVERAETSENADNTAEKQSAPAEAHRPLHRKSRQYPRLCRRINLLPHPHRHLHRHRQRNWNRQCRKLPPNLRLRRNPPPAGTSTPSRRLSGRATSMRGRNTA